MAAQELTKTVLKDNTNLKAYYRFESGALTTDSSGQGKTLTNNNTATETTGVYGGGVALNGTDQTMSIADVLVSGATNWSVSTWVKLDSLSKTGQIWYCGAYPTSGFGVITTNGTNGGAGDQISLLFHNVGWFHTGVSIGTTTSFVHIVVTRDTTTTRVYLNGKHIYLTTTAPTAPAGAFVIGKDGTGGSYYFDGSIDDLAVFNTALSADQIKELYEGRYLGELRPNQFGTTAALYHLSSTTDGGGNNYHLTNTNTVGFVAGRFGNCADFGSSNTNKQLSVADPMSINGGAISVSLWVKAQTEIGSGAYGLFIHGNNTSQTAYGVNYEYNSGTRRLGFFRTQYAVGKTQGNYTVTLGTTSWHHIVLTYDTTNIKGYINGDLVVTQAASGSGGGTYLNGLIVGSENGSNYASVFIDELQISSTALTANQIRTMYALGTGKHQ